MYIDYTAAGSHLSTEGDMPDTIREPSGTLALRLPAEAPDLVPEYLPDSAEVEAT